MGKYERMMQFAENLQAELELTKRRLAESADREGTLNGNLRELRQKSSGLRKQVDELTKSLESSAATTANLSDRLKAADQRYADCRSEISQLKGVIADLEGVIESYKGESKTLACLPFPEGPLRKEAWAGWFVGKVTVERFIADAVIVSMVKLGTKDRDLIINAVRPIITRLLNQAREMKDE